MDSRVPSTGQSLCNLSSLLTAWTSIVLVCKNGSRHRPRQESGVVRVGERQVKQQGDNRGGCALRWRCFCPRSAETHLPQAPAPGRDQTGSQTCSCFPGGSPYQEPAFGQRRHSLDKQESLEKLVKDSTEPHSQHPSGAQAPCNMTASWPPISRPPGQSGAFISPDPEGGPTQGPACLLHLLTPSWGKGVSVTPLGYNLLNMQ